MEYKNSVFIILIFSMLSITGESYAKDTSSVKRTYGKDLFGYNKTEKDLATGLLENTLYPKRKDLKERIKVLEGEKKDNATKRDLEKAKQELQKITQDIADQEVIAGKKYSTFKKGSLYALSATAFLGLGIAADYFLNSQRIIQRLSYEYHMLQHDTFLEGGLSNYFRNRIVGEPYKIRPVSELEFWNRDAHEWQPVAGNEELAKRSLVITISAYETPTQYDETRGIMIPHRGHYYFWDPLIDAFRRTTFAEDNAHILNQHLPQWMAKDTVE